VPGRRRRRRYSPPFFISSPPCDPRGGTITGRRSTSAESSRADDGEAQTLHHYARRLDEAILDPRGATVENAAAGGRAIRPERVSDQVVKKIRRVRAGNGLALRHPPAVREPAAAVAAPEPPEHIIVRRSGPRAARR